MGNYGSYGGRMHKGQNITKMPVIFIHGNSDMALKNPSNTGSTSMYQTGWTNSIQVGESSSDFVKTSLQYFLSQGYTQAEMYATTWGPANATLAQDQTHNCK